MFHIPPEENHELKGWIRKLYMALICQMVGSMPFRSAVLSFCAMISRRKSGGSGLWEEAGNYNSHLSALTWTAQLIIFDYACHQNQDDEDRIPAFLTDVCSKTFQQLAETPFGHILQWRLYLFKVSKAAIAMHQARWSVDGQNMTFRGVELRMSHIEQLVASEFRQAHSLLYDKLMFKSNELVPMQSWRLRDDLDTEDAGVSWLTNKGNTELVQSADIALLGMIQGSAELRRMFIIEAKDGDGMMLSVKAIAVYEGYVQQFLKQLLVLCHITAGQPLREPELLSITWCNTARMRHVYIWEKLVLIYTQYHKGQQQSGLYKDNVRFLPRAIGDMLLDYIAYVIPLQQIFLRQQQPKALISPYLWAKTGGVWSDGAVTACLRRACARADIPSLHTANWCQMSMSICKEKFGGGDRASFDLEGDAGDDEESELMAMAEQSNHSYRTFNQAYAGSSTLTMNVLLHRAYKASSSWHSFFRFDRILDGKRPRGMSEVLSLRVMDAAKHSQARPRKAYSESDLLDAARKLYSAPDLQFRAGQRRGLVAMMVKPVEQLVLILGTGSGKTLVFLVGTAVAEDRTTILVIPAVALRGDMVSRCREVGIQPLRQLAQKVSWTTCARSNSSKSSTGLSSTRPTLSY
ncbi:hypothetical protein GMDG_08537 [Pseudogymnoascus destructans 20631-21]|uniref:Helicase ATP-binding domain-containing protein n=1 Tax=Pseudogymnoascus destructans (strain ATCC MYA-4855 / 20631-21) TaxID=658429 RepID=L8G3A6_PSED2|nr:hypothetical protein GMDG_08537 [Pseudogymnoascus destructans 20631-21]